MPPPPAPQSLPPGLAVAVPEHGTIRPTLALMLPFSFLALGFYIIGKWSHAVQQKLQLAFDRVETLRYGEYSKAGEFVCSSCFLVKPDMQLADAKKKLCLDCV